MKALTTTTEKRELTGIEFSAFLQWLKLSMGQNHRWTDIYILAVDSNTQDSILIKQWRLERLESVSVAQDGCDLITKLFAPELIHTAN